MRASRLLLALGLALALAACNDSKTADPIPSLTTNPPTTTAAPTTEPTTAIPTITPSVPDSPAPLGQPGCKSSALTITDADTLTDPSSVREVYSVRTTGADCQLEGYPTVTFPSAIKVAHSGYGVPTKADPVTLSRSTSVSFEIGSGRSGSCSTLTTITVTLPGTTTGKRVATSLKVCGNAVAISPVLRRGDID